MKTKLIIFFLSILYASGLWAQPHWFFSAAMNNPGGTGLVALGTAGSWEASSNSSAFVPAIHVSNVIAPNPPYWWVWSPEVNGGTQNDYGWVSYPFTASSDPKFHSGAADMLYRIKFFLPASPLLTVDLDIWGDDFVLDVSVNGNVITTYPTPPTGQTGQNGNLNVPVKFISTTNWIPNDTNTIVVHCSSNGGHAGLMVRANAPSGTSTGVAVQLSDKNVIVLNQNVPNPFAESTTIAYNIPSDFKKAQIIFTTIDGLVIKSVNITEKGAGSLNVFANDLSHGMYSYTLVVDGKTIDTKKMVKE